MYGSLGESTIPKYMNSLCQCWSVYGSLQEVYGSIRQSIGEATGSLGESACCKGTSIEVLGSLGESTLV